MISSYLVVLFCFQVELLELIGGLNFKVISYLESVSQDIIKGDHNFLGVSLQTFFVGCTFTSRCFRTKKLNPPEANFTSIIFMGATLQSPDGF